MAKRLVNVLETTVGYLHVETEKANLFKDPAMLKRLAELKNLDDKNKSHILTVLDGFLQSVKLKKIAVG